MKRKLLFTLIASLLIVHTKAQTLEEVNMSPYSGSLVHFSTYLTDINDNGFVTGYYDNTFQSLTSGLIITPTGKQILLTVPGNSVVKVEGINESNVALVTASNGTTTSTYKYYMDMATDTIGKIVQVTNFQQPNAVPTGINNKHEITGWYTGATNRWLFQSNDSIPLPAGSSAWNASRYMQGIVYYNTQAAATNDNGKTCGFYFSGNVIAPFIYTASNNSYTILNTSFKMHLYDINNSDMVVGDFQMANGTYTSFWGQVTGAGIIQVHNMNSLFAAAPTPIQSVANGINEKGEVVGSYLHPVTNTWVGFIYRPNQNGYRLPGFDFNNHTSSMHNTNGMPNDLWSPSYYSGFKYAQVDPYVPAAGPLIDPVIAQRYASNNILAFPDSAYVSWNGYASEKGLYNGSIPMYMIRKHLEFNKFLGYSKIEYSGGCWGFAYSALLRAYKDGQFSSLFGVPAGSNLYSYSNTASNVVLGIERMYIKQYDNYIYSNYNPDNYMSVKMWSGLYRLKQECMKTAATTNPAALGFSYLGNEHHAVTPYKIHTPQRFPFNYPTLEYDSLYYYDSNYPGDSTRMVLIKSRLLDMPHDSSMIVPAEPNYTHINFNEATINEVAQVTNAAFKTTAVQNDFTSFRFSLQPDLHYTITDQAAMQAKLDQSGFTNSSTDVVAIEPQDTKSTIPIGFTLDTLKTVTVTSNDYTGSAMNWTMYNNLWAMGLNRTALPGESDHSTFGNQLMTYGNPDAVSKSLTGYFNEIDLGLTKGVSIIAASLSAAQGDSLVTESPSEFLYSIKRIGGTATTYSVHVYTVLNDTLKAFTTGNIPIAGTTTHVIDPFFNDGGVIKTVIKVDNGNNGSNEDTIFISEVPLNLDGPGKNVAYVSVHPNPVTDNLSIRITSPGTYRLFLSDIHGRKVSSQVFNATGVNHAEIAMSPLALGTYLLHIIDPNGNLAYRKKILKQ